MDKNREKYIELVGAYAQGNIANFADQLKTIKDCRNAALLALANALDGNYQEAEEMAAEAKKGECSPFETSVIMESELITVVKNRNLSEVDVDEEGLITSKCLEIIKINNEAYVAHDVLGTIALAHNRLQEALDHHLHLHTIFPNQKKIISRIISILLNQKEYKEARRYIQQLPAGKLRWKYWLYEKIIGRFRFLWILAACVIMQFASQNPWLLPVITLFVMYLGIITIKNNIRSTKPSSMNKGSISFWAAYVPILLFLLSLTAILIYGDFLLVNQLFPYNYISVITSGILAGFAGIYVIHRREIRIPGRESKSIYGGAAVNIGCGIVLFSWLISSIFIGIFLVINDVF